VNIKTVEVFVFVENGTLTYIDSKKKKELGIYETYFIEKKQLLRK